MPQSRQVDFASMPELKVQEERREIQKQKKMLVIGIPKECCDEEKRIPLIPESVKQLVAEGHRVLIQNGAGESAFYSDHDFTDVGAEMVPTLEEVFEADVIVKIQPLTESELEVWPKGKTLFSALQFQSREKSYFRKLSSKKTTAVAYELIREKSGNFPLLKAMSEIVGSAVMMIGADYLSDPHYGNGTMVGSFPGIKPTQVVFVGAGTVVLNACRTAIGMGCIVKVFDDSICKLRDLQQALGNRVYTNILDPQELEKAIVEADILVSAKHSSSSVGCSPVIVKESTVKRMKAGSVIIDVSIDQGGCCETSRLTNHKNPVYELYGVTHYCVPNIASKVPRTASLCISNYLQKALLQISEFGDIEGVLQNNANFAHGVYCFNGKLTNRMISEKFGLPFKPLELILPMFLKS
jgi:Alanine dehydrogenase